MKVPTFARKSLTAIVLAAAGSTAAGCMSYEQTTRYRTQPGYNYGTTTYQYQQRCPVYRDGYGRAYQTHWNGYRCV